MTLEADTRAVPTNFLPHFTAPEMATNSADELMDIGLTALCFGSGKWEE